jgi:predicted MPP superfamily phosphohydrolase
MTPNKTLQIMKKRLLAPVALLLLLISSCKKDDQWITASATADNTVQKTTNAYGNIGKDHLKIAVLSDIHYMHQSLAKGNLRQDTAFIKDILPNKTYQEYSAPILRKVLAELMSLQPDIVLIAGDLAKDGEEVSHKEVAELLEQLKSAGMKIYITVGNNDINNPAAVSYNGGIRTRVANVTATQFAGIYKDFGYGNYKYKDPNSLSYIAEPYPGLWILSIDAAKYAPFKRSGAIKPETMEWLKPYLEIAQNENITVLGLMHHNLFEHFANQNGITMNTVIDPSTTIADVLAAAGMKVMFTGHSHALDMALRTSNGHTIYDVVTSSLITYPSAYRIMILKNKELDIDTRYITSIGVPMPSNQDFTAYGKLYQSFLMDQYFKGGLKALFGMPDELIPVAVPLARNAYMAHLAGDEKLPPLEQTKINAFSKAGPESATKAIWALWTDSGVKDTKWHIKLTIP